jgi:uncharacterized protein
VRKTHQTLLCVAMAALAVVAAGGALRAQEEAEPTGTSYITPFPKGEIYKVALIGDDLADGLVYGVADAFANDTRLQINQKHFNLNGVMRPDFDEKIVALEETLKADPPHIAVVMLGLWDRVSLRNAEGKKIPVGTPEWRAAYGARADKLMKMLKRRNASVYWVGLPNLRKWDANEDVQMMNEVLRERVYLNSMKYIDSYAGFLDEGGGYSAWGPDMTGKIVRLRDNEGLYFTFSGNRKLAHFVERDLRRDLNQAKNDRVVPLAGSEAEQEKINPDKAVVKDQADNPAAAGKAAAAEVAKVEAGAGGSGDQKADNGKISLKTILQNGREEVATLEIVRPAIPASVVALVTRKESADKPSQMGEVLVDQISGGLNVMSTITPPSTALAAGASGRLSPTQSPFYRVLVKGERLTPRRGRADDLVWPRPEASAAKTLPEADAVETGAAPGLDGPDSTQDTTKIE